VLRVQPDHFFLGALGFAAGFLGLGVDLGFAAGFLGFAAGFAAGFLVAGFLDFDPPTVCVLRVHSIVLLCPSVHSSMSG